MNDTRRKELEARGFTVTDAYTFLGLTAEEKSFVDLRREVEALTTTVSELRYELGDLKYDLKDELSSMKYDILDLYQSKQDIGE